MSKRTVLAALTLLSAVAGCGAAPTKPTSHPPTSATPVASSSPTPTPTPMPPPTAPASTPLGAGERVWAAFAQGGQPYTVWWAQLSPLLSDAARAIYVYDDPQRIPTMTLTGPIHLAAHAPGEPRYTAEVVVATSKGVFALDLERHTLTSRWLLYAIKFPSGVQ